MNKKEKNIRYTFLMPDSLKKKIMRMAGERGMMMSSYIRMLLQEKAGESRKSQF